MISSQKNQRRWMAAIFNFVKMLIISVLNKDIYTQFRTDMQHGADYGQQLLSANNVIKSTATITTSSLTITNLHHQ